MERGGPARGAGDRHPEARVSGRRTWLRRGAQAILVIAITWGLFRAAGLDLGRLDAAELSRLRPSAALLALATAVLSLVYVAHALLWRRILADLTGRRLTAGATIRVYFLASLGRYIPGKVWQVAGLAVLARREGVSPVLAVGSAILGQLAFLSSGLVVAAAFLPGALELRPLAWGAAAAVIVAAALYLLRGAGPIRRLARRLDPRIRQPVDEVVGLVRGVRARRVGTWFVAYLATWAVLAGAFALFVAGFDPAAAADVAWLAGVVAVSYLAGYLAFIAPAGVGVREGVMSLLLAQVMPAPAAAVVAVCSRLWFTVAELAPVATIPFLRPPGAGPTAAGEEGTRSVVAP